MAKRYSDGIGVDKKTILTAIILFALFASIGFSVVTYKDQIMPYLSPLSDRLQPATAFIQEKITWIQTAWATLPEGIRGIILLGIPTAASLFFAWSKNRAMQKLQQTQQEAAAMQQQAATTIGGLQSQLGGYEQLQTTANLAQTQISGFQSQIDTLRQQLSTKETEIQKLIGERNLEGAMLTRVQSLQVPCRFCNKPIPQGLRFCPYCGRELIIA